MGIDEKTLPFLLLGVLLFCELTDLVDGFIARKRNEVTALGKILDPMADTITRLTVLFTFTKGVVSLPLLLVFVFLYRELVIGTLRTICGLKGVALGARKSGKIKAIFQALVNFVIVLLMIPFSWGHLSLHSLQNISVLLVSLAAIYSASTAIDYLYANRKYIKEVLKEAG